MKFINLPSGHTVKVDDEDYEWLADLYGWCINTQGYAILNKKKDRKHIRLLMHRLIMLPPSNMDVDHKNGDRLDNRRANLRICTRQQNMWNRKKSEKITRKSIYKGVGQSGKKWYAFITFNNVRKHLGTFETEFKASIAYDKAAKELFGSFARPNI